jgi:hypothetical protein
MSLDPASCTVVAALRSGRDAAMWLLSDILNERIACMNTMDLEQARYFETSIIAQ